MELIESIPNISEGCRVEIVDGIADAVRGVPGIRFLDLTSDVSHNRSVLTFAGDGATVKSAVLALFEAAVASIDLRTHTGEHPRLGAVDVVPLVPLTDVTMARCVTLAHEIAREVADRFAIPVFLYEEAAANQLRRALEDIRRGQFEGLAAKMAQPGWKPDYGPSSPHPSAGATVIGARRTLIAYNVNLATNRIDLARAIAAAVRSSGGGLPFVKAMGVALRGRDIVQVSMNLTNYEVTPPRVVFETVEREARRVGVDVLESEIVGLIPESALPEAPELTLKLSRDSRNQVLESRLRDTEHAHPPC